ncbi:MAG: hypothetical protein KAI89_01905 [Emcibacter sp.]|nr:hypothetical protein [Emcibacter sp.]
MSVEQELQARAESKCELCGAEGSLAVYDVPPTSNGTADQAVLICSTCRSQIEDPAKVDANHWRCLNDSMWTPVPAVHVMAWRGVCLTACVVRDGHKTCWICSIWKKMSWHGLNQGQKLRVMMTMLNIWTVTVRCYERATP